MRSLEGLRGVEAAEEIWVEALEPRGVEVRDSLSGLEPAGVERRGDRRQRGSPVRSANRLRPAVDSGDGRVRAAGPGGAADAPPPCETEPVSPPPGPTPPAGPGRPPPDHPTGAGRAAAR